MRVRIGTSGWTYKHWRGTFYPDELRVKDQFDYYAEHFDTVELNGSHYRWPADGTRLLLLRPCCALLILRWTLPVKLCSEPGSPFS